MDNNLLLQALIAILTIITTCRIIGGLILKIGQPRIIGEMLAGIVLGPTILGFFYPELYTYLFQGEVKSILYLLSNLGLSIYMFLIGLEFNITTIRHGLLKRSSIMTGFGFFVPLMCGILLSFSLPKSYIPENVNLVYFSLFIGICISTTAFPMIARVLKDRGMSKTSTGLLMIFSGSMMDVIGWIGLALITTLIASNSPIGGLNTLLYVGLLLLVLIVIVRPILSQLFKRQGTSRLSQDTLALVIGLIILCSAVTELIGMHSIFGGFILGMIMPREELINKQIEEKISDFTMVVLLPVFFTYSGINTTIPSFTFESLFVLCLIILFSFGSKYLTCAIVSRSFGYSLAESSAIGSLMNARGLIELIVLNVGYEYGLIGQELYNLFVWMAIITTVLAMPMFNFSIRYLPQLSNSKSRLDIS